MRAAGARGSLMGAGHPRTLLGLLSSLQLSLVEVQEEQQMFLCLGTPAPQAWVLRGRSFQGAPDKGSSPSLDFKEKIKE